MNEKVEHLEHLLTGKHSLIISVLEELKINYTLDDFDIYISHNDYHEHKNLLASKGVI